MSPSSWIDQGSKVLFYGILFSVALFGQVPPLPVFLK